MNRSWAGSGERRFVKEPYRKRRNNGSDKTLAPRAEPLTCVRYLRWEFHHAEIDPVNLYSLRLR